MLRWQNSTLSDMESADWGIHFSRRCTTPISHPAASVRPRCNSYRWLWKFIWPSLCATNRSPIQKIYLFSQQTATSRTNYPLLFYQLLLRYCLRSSIGCLLIKKWPKCHRGKFSKELIFNGQKFQISLCSKYRHFTVMVGEQATLFWYIFGQD